MDDCACNAQDDCNRSDKKTQRANGDTHQHGVVGSREGGWRARGRGSGEGGPQLLHLFVHWRSLGPTPVLCQIQVHMMLSRATYARNAFAHATINTFRCELSRCLVSRSARTCPFFCELLDGQRWSSNVPDPPSSSASCFASASGRANSDFRHCFGSVQRTVAQERCGSIQCVTSVVDRWAAINSRF